MRAIAMMAITVGCAASIRPADVTTKPTNANDRTMSAEDFSARSARLRATLARNHIAIDTEPVIETCAGSDLHGRCVRCDVAGVADTAGFDPDMLDAISLAFAVYPEKALAGMHLEHVALCSKIRFSDEPDVGPAGVAMLGERRVLVSIEPFHGGLDYETFTIEQVVHHELFHMLDDAAQPGAHADREWAALNPKGFAYRDPADKQVRPDGFVDGYATTNDDEDRASTFEYLMGQPDKLCELAKHDPILAAKTRVVWKRAAKVVGERLLRRSAPCVIGLRHARCREGGGMSHAANHRSRVTKARGDVLGCDPAKG
ncbi:MAG TPA: hypothetical protein VLB44_18395 [Kofleriaceae bacterium]|nr:hypothetical protein [Kofleriaceae bacterium]